MFDYLYNKIKEQILSNAPCTREVLFWNEQSLYTDEHLPFPTPCAFLSFENIEYNSVEANVLHCNYELVVRLGVEDLTKDSLNIFPISNELDFALHNFGTEEWGGENLFMFNKVIDNSYDRLNILETRYRAGFKQQMNLTQSIEAGDWGYSVTGYTVNNEIAFQYDIPKEN